MKIAFIGLGSMGRPMARRLLEAGHRLQVHDVAETAREPLVAGGAAWAPTPARAAHGAELVFTCLPGPSQVEAVALGADGLFEAMDEGSAWFDFTTSSPALARRLHARFAARGVHLLDAPVSGGPGGAAGGQLAFWVGGDETVYARYVDVLRCMGDKPTRTGDIGTGCITKLAHNCANFTVQAAVAEVFTLAVKAGVDPLVLFGALRDGTTGRRRTFDRIAEQFLPGRYDPPEFALDLAVKDMTLACAVADEQGVPLRLARLAMDDMLEAARRGWGQRDARIALSLNEERAGVSVRVPAEQLDRLTRP